MAEKFKDDEVVVRAAKREDMVAVFGMIQELADFEKMPDGPKISAEVLERDGFDTSPPSFRCVVAEAGRGVAGYAIYFPTYSTWEGRALMLEDLYVRESERRRGLGRRLFNAVAKEAVSFGCSRLDFHVLQWNPAVAFYRSLGAVDLTRAERWSYYRLAGDRLRAVAAAAGHTQ